MFNSKHLILFAGLLLAAMPCAASITLVGSSAQYCGSSTSCSPSAISVNANDAVLVIASDGNYTTFNTPTDSASNTYTASSAQYSGSGGGARMWWACAGTTTSLTVTDTLGTADYFVVTAIVFRGTACPSNPVDVAAAWTDGSSTGTISLTTVNTGSNSGDVIVGYYANGATSGAPTAGSGFTIPSGGTTTFYTSVEYDITTSTYDAAPQFASAKASWDGGDIALKASGGAAAKNCTIAVMGAGRC